jgi:hypothetical protein
VRSVDPWTVKFITAVLSEVNSFFEELHFPDSLSPAAGTASPRKKEFSKIRQSGQISKSQTICQLNEMV